LVLNIKEKFANKTYGWMDRQRGSFISNQKGLFTVGIMIYLVINVVFNYLNRLFNRSAVHCIRETGMCEVNYSQLYLM